MTAGERAGLFKHKRTASHAISGNKMNQTAKSQGNLKNFTITGQRKNSLSPVGTSIVERVVDDEKLKMTAGHSIGSTKVSKVDKSFKISRGPS